jgi:phenylalanyl-tRNA synthetase alpha chain
MNHSSLDSGRSSSNLHQIEKSLLKALANEDKLSVQKLSEISNLPIDQVRRGIEWLKYKNLITTNDKSIFTISLGKNGLFARKNKLPERRLVEAIEQGHQYMHQIASQDNLTEQELVAAVKIAKRNNWIEIKQDSAGRTICNLSSSASNLSPEEKLLDKLEVHNQLNILDLTQEEMQAFNNLKRRGNYLEESKKKDSEILITKTGKELLPTLTQERPTERRLTQEMISSGKWKELHFSPLDVEASVPSRYLGLTHPLTDLISEVKEIFVGLGFVEIEGPVTQPSFWNFDALFIPQDHPAREMQDTFYISEIDRVDFASRVHIQKISEMHQKGWKYKWNKNEAQRMLLRTHTTAVTIKYLADNKPDSAKVFSIGRVFRNEKVSYKHLVEFNQVEGIFTSKHLTLRNLMGLQREFYSKLGIKKVKFWPTFFPYTEPSVQSMVYNESLQKWVELFGMGILRPEVTKPLGISNPVLAWGGGIERIAMLRFGLNDLRDLYNNRLGWLRGVSKCPS